MQSVCGGNKEGRSCMSVSRARSRHRQSIDEACFQILQIAFKNESVEKQPSAAELINKLTSHIINLKCTILCQEKKNLLLTHSSIIAAIASKRTRDFDHKFIKSLPFIMDGEDEDSNVKVVGEEDIMSTEDLSEKSKSSSMSSSPQPDILCDISNVHLVEIPQSGTAPVSLVNLPKPKNSPLKATDQILNSESFVPSTPEQAKNPEVKDITIEKVENFIKKNTSKSGKPIQLVMIRQPQSLSPEGEQKYLITASPVDIKEIDNNSPNASFRAKIPSPNKSNNCEHIGEYYVTIRKTPSTCVILEKLQTDELITDEPSSTSVSENTEKLTVKEENINEPVNAMRKIFKSNRKIVKYNASNVLDYTPCSPCTKGTSCCRKRKLTPEKVSYTHTCDLKIASEMLPEDAILDKAIIFEENKEYKEKLAKILNSIEEELWKFGEMDELLQSYELDTCSLNSSTPPLVELLGHDLAPEQDTQDQIFSDIFENENLKDLFLNSDFINNLKELSKL